jgi:hypothetical protein
LGWSARAAGVAQPVVVADHRATPYLAGKEQKISNRSLFDLKSLQAEQSLYIDRHSAPICHHGGAVI